MSKLCFFRPTLLALVSLLAAAQACAQDYPSRPIRIFVANAAGGAPDVIIRLVSPELSKLLGQPVVIENKTGAGSIIGYEFVAKQVTTDGYTLAVCTVPTLASMPVAVKNLRFDPLRDLPPVIGIADGRLALFTSADSPWKNFNDMVSEAKGNPGKLNYGSSVFLIQVLSEAIIRARGIDVASVFYRDSSGLSTAVMSSQVHFGMLSLPTVTALGNKVKILAVTGAERAPQYPGVSTFVELGLPQVQSTGFSLNAPVGVPKTVLAKLHALTSQVLKQPEIVARFKQLGFDVADQAPDAAAKRLLDEGALFADIARKAGIQPQ